MLTREQLAEMYSLCLDDVERRIRILQETAGTLDAETFRTSVHTIKGTCGMVGALELAALATSMEESTPPAVDDLAPYLQFLIATAQLRRILNAKSIQLSTLAGH